MRTASIPGCAKNRWSSAASTARTTSSGISASGTVRLRRRSRPCRVDRCGASRTRRSVRRPGGISIASIAATYPSAPPAGANRIRAIRPSCGPSRGMRVTASGSTAYSPARRAWSRRAYPRSSSRAASPARSSPRPGSSSNRAPNTTAGAGVSPAASRSSSCRDSVRWASRVAEAPNSASARRGFPYRIHAAGRFGRRRRGARRFPGERVVRVLLTPCISVRGAGGTWRIGCPLA